MGNARNSWLASIITLSRQAIVRIDDGTKHFTKEEAMAAVCNALDGMLSAIREFCPKIDGIVGVIAVKVVVMKDDRSLDFVGTITALSAEKDGRLEVHVLHPNGTNVIVTYENIRPTERKQSV